MDQRLAVFDEKMGKTMNNLAEEFGGIRAGRANPHVLDKLRVDYYGTPTAIQQVANVSVPEPRMIQIQPWEASKEDVSEDEIKQLEDQAQKMTDKYIADVDRAVEAKTKEILTV